ncbi:MAG: MlaD family protein, partial [Phycisphaeraceae bacterium]
MEERTRNVAVGLTALVGLVGLMALLLLFGWVPGWLDGGYRITVKLPHAAGLSEESRVELNGIPVGRVESLGLMPQPDTGVVAELSIRSGVAIPEDAEAVVRAPLLLGGQSRIEFTTAEMDEVEDVLEPGAVVRGSIPDLASQLTQEFRSALAGPEAVLSAAVESFESLSSEWQ